MFRFWLFVANGVGVLVLIVFLAWLVGGFVWL